MRIRLESRRVVPNAKHGVGTGGATGAMAPSLFSHNYS